MSSTIFNKAFSLELSHDFYVVASKYLVNKDLTFAPTKECSALMQKGRMRFVPTPKGAVVFYQSYIDGTDTVLPLVELADGSEFV
ncbi:MAG TPA: hypothetical protein VFU15_06540, partial [Bacteroidia bacterium]|nr:hypothetical protein [Bacteroidia bacterium]